jgi:hypothetical protein
MDGFGRLTADGGMSFLQCENAGVVWIDECRQHEDVRLDGDLVGREIADHLADFGGSFPRIITRQ